MVLNSIRNDFGSKAYYITKSFININREFRIGIARKQFLLNCRSQNYFPKNILNATTNLRKLHFYSNKSKFHMNNIVNKFEHCLRNEEIKDIHYHLRGSSTLWPRFLYCFLRMNCRETNNAIEVRFFAFNLFIYILSTKVLLKFYCLQFDRDFTLKYPLRKMYTKTVDMI